MSKLETRPSGLVVARNNIEVPVNPVKFHSSTLRDGQQHTGIVYSVRGKDRVATLEHAVLNPEIIEGGWPGATDTDTKFFQVAKDRPYHDRLAAFGMLQRPGSHVESDAGVKHLIDSDAPIITYVGKTHIEQVRTTLKTTPEENLRMIEESVAYARAEGRRVIYDAEHFFDSYDLDPEYAMETLYAAARGGAESIALCDTVGKQLPSGITEKVSQVMADEKLHAIYREKYAIAAPDEKMPLGIHAHNDLELAVANTLTAIDAGATYVQGTGAGKGERVGNANLTVLAYLLDREGYRELTHEQKQQLTLYDNTIYEEAGIPKNPNQPISGKRSHGSMSGIHQGAMIRDASSYVIEDPANFGNDWDVFLSGQSGRSAVKKKMNDWGLPADADIVSTVTDLLKSKENEGYRWIGQEASVELLMRRQLPDYEETKPFIVEPGRDEDNRITSAAISFTTESNPVAVPIENGDVDSIFGSVRHGLSLVHVELLGLRSVNSHIVRENGTTRAFITVTNGKDSWTTVGVGKNATEAGLEAASDALEYAMYHPKAENNSDE